MKHVDKVKDPTFLISYNRERKEIDKDLLANPRSRKKDNIDTGMHTEHVNFHKVNTGVNGVSITQVRT